jgi:hypothetical protein
MDAVARTPNTSTALSKTPDEHAVVIDVDAASIISAWQTLARATAATREGALWQAFLEDLVRSAMGLVAAEIWVDVDKGAGVSLERMGYYIEPSFEPSDAARRALQPRPSHAVPGVGLVGMLWVDAARGTEAPSWKLLSALAKDEDIHMDARTDAAAATFGVAAAVFLDPTAHLSHRSQEHVDGGLLVLYARAGVETLLSHPANLAYLRSATSHAEALIATAQARQKLSDAKRHRSNAWRKLRLLLKTGLFLKAVKAEAAKLEAGTTKLVSARASAGYTARLLASATIWVRGYLRKFRGVPGSKAPPLKGWRSSAAWRTFGWTWVGITLTLLGLGGLSLLTEHLSDGEHFLMLGSFGALMALQFGAPNSPLAQPRNAVLGCTLAGSISILVYYLSGPDFLGVLPKWAACAIAPATAIAICQRVNLLHPPAGAAALIFVSAPARVTSLGWMYLLLPLLLGNLFCCAMAMLVNNAAKERQYPVFW